MITHLSFRIHSGLTLIMALNWANFSGSVWIPKGSQVVQCVLHYRVSMCLQSLQSPLATFLLPIATRLQIFKYETKLTLLRVVSACENLCVGEVLLKIEPQNESHLKLLKVRIYFGRFWWSSVVLMNKTAIA